MSFPTHSGLNTPEVPANLTLELRFRTIVAAARGELNLVRIFETHRDDGHPEWDAPDRAFAAARRKPVLQFNR
jgi:hypothetical protein